jgi:hypothetical protein
VVTPEQQVVHLHKVIFDKAAIQPVVRHKHEWQKIETSLALLGEVCRCGATREILN